MSATVVCHVTSLHPRGDARIFRKEATATRDMGFRTIVIVADGFGKSIEGGVEVVDVGNARRSLFARLLIVPFRIFFRIRRIKPDLVHLHDPELLPLGYILRLKQGRVIYDAHEDVAKQVRSKHYIPKAIRPGVSLVVSALVRLLVSRMTALVAATPAIAEVFGRLDMPLSTVRNFPLVQESPRKEKGRRSAPLIVCYVGGLTKSRGLITIVQAMERVTADVRLHIAGEYQEPELRKRLSTLSGWSRVDELGWLSRSKVYELLGRSLAGLVVLEPVDSYVDSLPVKMFEYMNAGIPVICSDFPLWRSIVQGANCGICVSPNSPDEVARAIDDLAENRELADRMGSNGREAIDSGLNWESEKEVLSALYCRVLESEER